MTQIGRPIREITVEPLQIPVLRREPTPTVPVWQKYKMWRPR